jgi:endonuclease/exonuclease/phosphatase family metal-dependent hydrolase
VIIQLATDHTFKPWRGTLDYIFVNDRVRVLECDVTLNQPSPSDPTIYPSDHFGLTATLEIS